MLLQAAINIVVAAVALLVAASLIDGVTLEPTGFVTAVVVFVLAQAILGPFVFNIARQYASAILGAVGLVSTLLAVWMATLVADGLTLSTPMAWILTPLVVWIVTALGTWIFGYLVLKRWWDKRAEEKNIRRSMA
ncbi:phage holin family protein [Nesterenkonia sp. CF4.4]|uniref:phage holin family protein n=1 Tax=Nesterenkonia sp. CF4.4 TaxID=3373079 RepID=UPI003EE7C509